MLPAAIRRTPVDRLADISLRPPISFYGVDPNGSPGKLTKLIGHRTPSIYHFWTPIPLADLDLVWRGRVVFVNHSFHNCDVTPRPRRGEDRSVARPNVSGINISVPSAGISPRPTSESFLYVINTITLTHVLTTILSRYRHATYAQYH